MKTAKLQPLLHRFGLCECHVHHRHKLRQIGACRSCLHGTVFFDEC